MHRRNVLIAIGGALVAPFALGAAARACGPETAFTKPIRFAPGAHEARIHQTIKIDLTHEWVLIGKRGQKVEIALDAQLKSGVTVMPDEAGGAKPRWGSSPKDGQFVKKWAGTLPKSGRMLIEVSTQSKADSYTLAVKLA